MVSQQLDARAGRVSAQGSTGGRLPDAREHPLSGRLHALPQVERQGGELPHQDVAPEQQQKRTLVQHRRRELLRQSHRASRVLHTQRPSGVHVGRARLPCAHQAARHERLPGAAQHAVDRRGAREHRQRDRRGRVRRRLQGHLQGHRRRRQEDQRAHHRRRVHQGGLCHVVRVHRASIISCVLLSLLISK